MPGKISIPELSGPDVLTLLRDEQGRALIFYHGSPFGDIKEFLSGTTADGIFFTSDEQTAAYYATGPDATIYHVHLRVSNLADFDAPEVFESVMRKAIDFSFSRNDEEARSFAARLYREGYDKNAAVRAFFDEIEGLCDVCDGYSVEQLLRDNRIGASEIDDLVHEIDMDSVTLAYNESAPPKSIELDDAREAYGSQSFYMNYQDDFMRAARSLGYDGVVFCDPSTTSQSISYVVFDKSQVVISTADRVQKKVCQQKIVQEQGMSRKMCRPLRASWRGPVASQKKLVTK